MNRKVLKLIQNINISNMTKLDYKEKKKSNNFQIGYTQLEEKEDPLKDDFFVNYQFFEQFYNFSIF